ncbi:Rieske domain protein [Cordyceps fumosorosea ARSEF 2679]|uniref:Choline monooxygenase, chloroplastic n=1 Tax=Cordyceps fumosorosea (strain ARSEF 2679) TaxID=1081104 RepID=A0A167Q5V0_CORFA|nr:Rieske domain protein [Cordyceps fumosorosea ARSEF 2679]OAA57323.1 Rieske domain protein [Cordyceps fumosorosea ARSEF 2679]
MSMLKSYLGLGWSNSASESKDDSNNTVRALPASWYTSQDMYELERRAIFSRRWLLTTHKLRLKNSGDWLKYEVAGFQFVLCRDRTGSINAFHNVCRHRAFPVVTGEQGNNKVFSCKYHGWSYGMNGKLAKAPGYQDMEDFDAASNGLLPIHVHVDHNGFIWVNMDGKEVPEVAWEDDFGGVDTQERIEEYNFDDYEFDHAWEMEGEYNWKILADNYNECYHCKVAHPDIPSIADLEAYKVEVKDAYIEHYANSTPEQIAKGFKVAPTYFFPNASMNVTPNFFFTQRFVPMGPMRSFMKYEVFRHKNADDEAFKTINDMYKRIMSEDKYLCINAQRNLSAGVFVNGEMHPTMEKGPLFFQRKVREAVREHHARETREGGAEIWPARQRLPCAVRGKGGDDDVEFCAKVDCGSKLATKMAAKQMIEV